MYQNYNFRIQYCFYKLFTFRDRFMPYKTYFQVSSDFTVFLLQSIMTHLEMELVNNR